MGTQQSCSWWEHMHRFEWISERRCNTNTSGVLPVYRKGRGNRQVSQWLLAHVMENVTHKEKGDIPNY